MSSKDVHQICVDARAAGRAIATRTTAQKNAVLLRIAEGLEKDAARILAANEDDVRRAKDKGLAPAMIDRLALDARRLSGVAAAVREIAALPDPVGEVVSRVTRPNGLSVTRVRVPLGVIAMIYESRPNVTCDASALALKAGNAIVLRGGSEALSSNLALGAVIRAALVAEKFPESTVQILETTDRDAMVALLRESDLVDLAIPRGGEALIRFVTENARVPVVQHYRGVCHLFVDEGFGVEDAARIVVDSKLSRPSACNALECLLVSRAAAKRVLPGMATALLAGGAELRADDESRALLSEQGVRAGERGRVVAATESDFGHEFLAPQLAVKIVADLDEALAHVARYGSGHTEAILTPNDAHAARFRGEVDAACVVVNASTRFHDGGELGLGAEIGIATSRLHWRGPMGLESLTTMKWVVEGEGQSRGT
jgi:glutamate-5-semialdehyde dehydrogenase